MQQRDWPAVQVRSTQEQGWLVLATDAVTLRYRQGSGPFSADNLEGAWHGPGGRPSHWHPDQVDDQNLGGLTYSLDGSVAVGLRWSRVAAALQRSKYSSISSRVARMMSTLRIVDSPSAARAAIT